MCGIYGIYSFQEPIDFIEKKSIDKLHHRGPDSVVTFEEENLFLAHKRLAILDLSDKGSQPFSYKNLVIVFNGEIYNYLEIRNKLIQGIRPDKEIFSGVITFISGVLFLIPGFLTDFIALSLLLPPIKNVFIRKYSFKPNYSRKQQNRKSVIDVEHKEDD